MRKLKYLKILNIVASVVVVLLAVYIVIYPYLPEVVSSSVYLDNTEIDTSQTENTSAILGTKITDLQVVPDDNRLIIPKISVDSPIGESTDKNALGQGMLHIPNTSTPDLGGNTVIIGHRVLFTSGPNTLYNLDKVAVNDLIFVYWKGKEYVYKVFKIKIVSPEQTNIEDNTNESIITLYTCTPRWTSQKRLVVRAILQ